MGRRWVYAFLVLGVCLGVARADLTMVPLSTWNITGDFGDVLALNGYPVSSLIVGKSVYANPPGQSPNEPAAAADDFTLKTSACCDGEPWMKTMFPQAVRIIFMLEKLGNDSGTIQGLDAQGNPVGGAVTFTAGATYWKSTGYLASQQSTQQVAFGTVITSTIPIYGILITAPGIDPVSIMAVGGGANVSAGPSPAAGATDVPRDTTLSWTPGAKAQTHDVYFGTVFADVNNADRSHPLNVLVSRGQNAATYTPGLLEFGQTYYWRIDDVNATDATVYKGEVWSFQVEPFAYPLPGTKITATASSTQANMGPEKTIDGSGLDKNDLHSADPTAMWLSAAMPPQWIEYQFDQAYEIQQLSVWNSNQAIESLLGFGAKAVTIEYSTDGVTWTALANVPEFARAPGTAGYAANTTVNFGGVLARYVKLIINSTWGAGAAATGLSEVRFSYVPVAARAPTPANGATGVTPPAVLSWRAGREAGSHQVYLGTDAASLALAGTVSGPTYTASVELGRTYFWKVVEVNQAKTPTSWASDVWSFSTADYLTVDDFESYTDQAGSAMFETWVDGYGTTTNGATVGNTDPTKSIAETTILHGGKQSMPLSYDNTSGAAYSEATRTFAPAQNWSQAGIGTLVLYFYGVAGNSGQLYVKVNGTKVLYPGDAANLTQPLWTQWNIDLASLGVNLQKVTTLTIGIDGTGSKGKLYLDDIRLYRVAPALPKEQVWIEAEAATTLTAPLQVYTDRPDASAGKYMGSQDNGQARTTAAGPGTDGTGLATYKFTVKGGTYQIRVREIVPSTSSDSWWVRIQGATLNAKIHTSGWIQWNNAPVATTWAWNPIISSDDNGKTVLFTMPAGTYTLEIAYREDGCFLDAFLITAQ